MPTSVEIAPGELIDEITICRRASGEKKRAVTIRHLHFQIVL
jgi:hypothetical protein